MMIEGPYIVVRDAEYPDDSCPLCDGVGLWPIQGTEVCPRCDGTGKPAALYRVALLEPDDPPRSPPLFAAIPRAWTERALAEEEAQRLNNTWHDLLNAIQ